MVANTAHGLNAVDWSMLCGVRALLGPFTVVAALGGTWLVHGIGVVATQATLEVGFRAWVGLYDPAHLGWLENENRLGELCPDPSRLAECYEEMLRPAVSVYGLYRAPDSTSTRVGDLIVVAVPGRGLSAGFLPAGSSRAIPFLPDLYLQDWGYGPYFHHTFLNQRGNWFQLPADPWDGDVWIDRESEREGSTVMVVQSGDLIAMGSSDLFVVDAESDALVVRAEQPGDLWCTGGEPPQTIPTEPARMSRAELTDSRGHLMFQLKNLKGC